MTLNVAEGLGRATTGEFLSLKYVNDEDVNRVLDLAADTARLLNGLIRSLRQKSLQN